MKVRKLTSALTMLSALVLFHSSRADEGKLQEKVVESWRTRESSCTSFKIKWKETQTYVAGSLSSSKTRGAILPPKTMESEASFALYVDGEKMKETTDSMEISEKLEMVRQQETMAFNGELNKTFRPPQIHEHPQGFIGDEKHISGLNVYNLRPILAVLKPFRYQKWGYFKEADLLNKYVHVDAINIGEHSCVVLRETVNIGPLFKELWLDSARNYIPLREVTFLRDKPILQIDWINYQRVKSFWVPVEWKIQDFDGEASKSISGKAVEYTVNQPIPSEEFEIDFPLGTWVVDRRNHDRAGNPTHYIVKPSGSRSISHEELATKSYRELSQNTESNIWRVLVLLGTIAVSLFIALCYYRRKKDVPS
jgi:hypothetical protein